LYIESCYNLIADEDINEKFKPNLELMKSISEVPKNWSIEHDEDLAELLKEAVNTDMPGSIRNLIKSVSVSTQRVNIVFSESKFLWPVIT
jgi:hypothetical protein